MLLSTGEQISISLCAMAIERMGYQAISADIWARIYQGDTIPSADTTRSGAPSSQPLCPTPIRFPRRGSGALPWKMWPMPTPRDIRLSCWAGRCGGGGQLARPPAVKHHVADGVAGNCNGVEHILHSGQRHRRHLPREGKTDSYL